MSGTNDESDSIRLQSEDEVELIDDGDESKTPVEQAEPEPEYQIGKSQADRKDLDAVDHDNPLAIAAGQTGTQEWQVEGQAVIKRLADDIYESPKEGIREAIANGETACVEGGKEIIKQEFGWDDSDFVVDDEDGTRPMQPKEILDKAPYKPKIEITYDKGDGLLVIQDNGIGFTVRVVREVLRHVARSGTKADATTSGQFGMGFLALFKLVSMEGSFTMYTRTRREDIPEEYRSFAAYFHGRGYDPIEGELPEGQYGTRLEFPLEKTDDGEIKLEKEYGSSYSDDPVLREWVKEYSQYANAITIYREIAEDGTEDFNEEWGKREFADDFDGAVLEMDRPNLFRAVCYPQASGDTVLVSMPIDRNYRYTPSNAPWQIDIRIKDEQGRIAWGPNAGKIPVSEEQYAQLPDRAKDSYILESQVEDDDIRLPEPTGDRGRLQSHDSFWERLGTEFEELYQSRLVELAEELDTPTDLFDMNDANYSFLMVGMSNYRGWSGKDADKFQEKIESELDVKLPLEVCSTVQALLESVEFCPRDRSNVSNKRNRTSEKAWRVHREARPDGEVFMGKTINEDKADIVWETHDDNQVAKVEDYEKFEEYCGWSYLKKVSKNEDEWEIPDNLKTGSSGKNNAGKPPEERKLTIREGSGQNDTTNKRCEYIKEQLESHHEDDDGKGIKLRYRNYVTKLILFPSNADENISDWYDYGESFNGVGMANCTVKAYEYLEDTPGVMHIDDLIEESKSIKLTTNEGKKEVQEVSDRLVVHVLGQEHLDLFRDDDVMDNAATHLDNFVRENPEGDYTIGRIQDNLPDDEDVVYAPVAQEAWEGLAAAAKKEPFLAITGDARAYGAGETYSFSSDALLYARLRLTWDDDIPEMKALQAMGSRTDTDNILSIVKTLAMLDDNGIEPASQRADDSFPVLTKEGKDLEDHPAMKAETDD